MPLSHTAVQHSSGALQVKSSSLHWITPQTLLAQTPLQQSKSFVHPNPSRLHIAKPHVKELGLQKPPQQSVSTMHGKASGLHAPHVEKFGLQNPVQHSMSLEQKKPSG